MSKKMSYLFLKTVVSEMVCSSAGREFHDAGERENLLSELDAQSRCDVHVAGCLLTNRRAIAMVFVCLPSVCLRRACTVIIRCILTRI